jgi:EAL and modified HD-GYP domain-containing signal transduction protein
MRLIGSLQDPDVEISQLQDIISTDVGLSYRLLRLVNSAFFALPREIESIRDAVVLLGINNIRRWATLMALTEVDDKPDELLVTGLVRARMCELAAASRGERDTDAYFTAGLFSVVDALMDSSMVELLSQLPLSPDLSAALLRYEGPKGEVLRGVLAYEQGNDAELGPLASLPAAPSELYSQAVQWATQASGGLSAAVPA